MHVIAAGGAAESTLGKAVAYTLNQWAKLRRCFDHAEVELSNNLAENSMRPIPKGSSLCTSFSNF